MKLLKFRLPLWVTVFSLGFIGIVFPADEETKTATLSIQGASCPSGCGAAIDKAIRAQEGVLKLDLDRKSWTATVTLKKDVDVKKLAEHLNAQTKYTFAEVQAAAKAATCAAGKSTCRAAQEQCQAESSASSGRKKCGTTEGTGDCCGAKEGACETPDK
jgi:copper chaperone CopZ